MIPSMSEVEDALLKAILEVLSERLGKDILRKVYSKALRKKLYKAVSNELFYTLLKDKKLELAPGFGSFILKQILEKDKKVFDQTSGDMKVHRVKGSKVIYKPGAVVKEFL